MQHVLGLQLSIYMSEFLFAIFPISQNQRFATSDNQENQGLAADLHCGVASGAVCFLRTGEGKKEKAEHMAVAHVHQKWLQLVMCKTRPCK